MQQKMKLLCTPTRVWGPALVRHRKLVDHVEGFVEDPGAEMGNHQYVNYGYDASMVKAFYIQSIYRSINKKLISDSNYKQGQK